MKRKDNFLPYSEQVKIEKIVAGSLWAVTGIFSMFNSVLCLILRMLSSVAIIYTLEKMFCRKAEPADEMAEQNLNKAKAVASDYILCPSLFVAPIASLFLRNTTLSFDLGNLIPAAVFFVVGCHSLITGMVFRKLEDS